MRVCKRREFGDAIGAEDKDSEQAQHHEDECGAEDGIDLSDDFVDGQQGRDEVVCQNDPDPDRMRNCRNHSEEDIGGTEKEYGTDDDHKNDAKHADEVPHAVSEVSTGNFGEAQAVVSEDHDSGQKIVHGAHEYSAESNPEEGDGPECGTEDRAEDRAGAGNIEQLDQEYLPTGHRDVIDSVVESFAGDGVAGIDLSEPFEPASVCEIGDDECCKTNEKSYHGSENFLRK